MDHSLTVEGAERYRRATRVLDRCVRWPLIYGVWLFIGWRLAQEAAWYWAAVWLLPGFILVMNLVGVATLPLYGVAAWWSYRGRR